MTLDPGASGASENPSGIDQQMKGDDKTSTQADQDQVSYETYQKTLKQVKSKQEKLQGLEDELTNAQKALAEIKAEKESVRREQDRLKEEQMLKQGKVEKVLEMKQQQWEQKEKKYQEELDKERSLRTETESTLEGATKLQAFFDKLPGKLKHRDYIAHVELENIIADPETGEIDDESLQKEVNKFMEKHKDLVDTKSFKSLPGQYPSGPGYVTAKTFKDLPLKDMRKELPNVVREAKRKFGL
jgi:DNA repair exonuclease SbcCD ATPase subunit